MRYPYRRLALIFLCGLRSQKLRESYQDYDNKARSSLGLLIRNFKTGVCGRIYSRMADLRQQDFLEQGE